MKDKLTVIILAGGPGTRLGDLTKSKPKALTMVCGKPIIEYSISFARALGAEKIVVVGGYLFDVLTDAVRAIDKDVVLVNNTEYKTTQRLAGLMYAKNEISGGFISYDGDYIYSSSIAEKVKKHLDDQIKIFGTDDESDEVQLDMMVKVDGDNNLINMKKGLTDYEYYFNSILYCPEKAVGAFFENAKEVLKKGDPQKTHVEEAVIEYASHLGDVKMVDLGYPQWVEVDTPEELEVAEKIIKKDPKGFYNMSTENNNLRCALCNSDNSETVCDTSIQKDGTVRNLNNVVCTRCGLVYNDPMPSDSALHEYYTGGHLKDHALVDDDFNTLINKLKQRKSKQSETKAKETISFIEPFISSTGSVLDIGCSVGAYIAALRKYVGGTVAGVEPDELSARAAIEFYGLRNIHNMFFEDYLNRSHDKFDLIILRHVFEHLKNPNQTIENIKTMLKPDGFWYLVIPNAYDFLESRPLKRVLEFGHVFSYTPYAISQMLLKHGLKIVKYKHDYIYHQQMVVTRIENNIDSVPFSRFKDGSDVQKLKARLKGQDMRSNRYRVQKKINSYLPFNIMSKKWKHVKDA